MTPTIPGDSLAADLFKRLAARRPPRQPKLDNSDLGRDIEKLHRWMQHKGEVTIFLREICRRGPRGMRYRKKALSVAEVLTGNGWLVPARSHRHDRYVWRIIRGLGDRRWPRHHVRHHRAAELHRPRTCARTVAYCRHDHSPAADRKKALILSTPKSPGATAPWCWYAAGPRERSPRALRRPRRRHHC
jgi:hypothetical protein